MPGGLFLRLAAFVVIVNVLALEPDKLAAGEEVTDFYNVVAPAGADPWLWSQNGWYYATVTTGGNVTLSRSRSLSNLGAAERKVVWTPSPETPAAKNLWAPELHRLEKAWYIYVAADDGANANHRMYVLENLADDPFKGEFVFKSKIVDPKDDRWAIDGTVLRVGERLFFVWSGWEGAEDIQQNLYIAAMSNPWILSGARVAISRPTLPWETKGAPPAVNEGPQVLVKDRRIHLIYSASGSWTDAYCLGRLTADIDADLLAPASWKKYEKPVFASVPGVYGPGHCSFTKSPDGREDWIVYHSARYRGAGWNRLLRAQPFSWDQDGFPRFGAPAPPDQPIKVPGGEPARQRYEAEAGSLVGAARVARQPSASRGAKVQFPGSADSTLTLVATVKEAGAYVVSIRYLNASDRKSSATQTLTVDDGPPLRVSYLFTGPADWSNQFVSVTLKTGPNRIRLGQGERMVEIDCLDITPGDR
ncbi:Beta-xylosidase, GH43 family [Singulisphaera sp. GP187]|uniref:family 43 glycosylhydrolase n=1 Tax=Singulisphaera sp. GP187 TaxID=1882752 RepID=UPI00092AD56A|nr:family 43 glycosylhydrolase [Singulisphaera sp. GP187]SIO60402.1 Beta-xylosidase, GH43 family [Singulisphaera sp. GP187]